MKRPKKRKTGLLETYDTTYNITKNTAIARYIETYIDCEVTAQKLIRHYKADVGKKAPVRLFLPNIIKAVQHFSLPVNDQLIFSVFPGGDGLRGQKSPRQLRNAYVHKKHPQDCLEMLEKETMHLKHMRAWLQTIKQHANTL